MASGLSLMANQVNQRARPSLKGSVDFTSMAETEDFVEDLVQSQQNGLNFDGLYKSLSMLVWGLIVLKAKMGIAAAATKDSETLHSSWSRVVKMILIVGIVSFAQLKY